MAVVSSIRHQDITNDFNDGANALKNFLHYAETLSKGEIPFARQVLEDLNPLAHKSIAPKGPRNAVVEGLAEALRGRGYLVDSDVGQSRFRCDLAVRSNGHSHYQLGILLDSERHYANRDLVERYLMQPSVLRAFGWRVAVILTKDWFHEPAAVLDRIERLLKNVPEEARDAEDGERAGEESGQPEVTEANVAEHAIDRSVGTLPTEGRGGPPHPGPLPEERERQRQRPEEENATFSKPTGVFPSPRGEGRNEGKGGTRKSESAASSARVRRFEFVGGGSQKFWEISVDGKALTVRFGRLGTRGQEQNKTYSDESKARREADKLIQEKLRKGYSER